MTGRYSGRFSLFANSGVPQVSQNMRAIRLPFADVVQYAFATPLVIVTSAASRINACAGAPPEIY